MRAYRRRGQKHSNATANIIAGIAVLVSLVVGIPSWIEISRTSTKTETNAHDIADLRDIIARIEKTEASVNQEQLDRLNDVTKIWSHTNEMTKLSSETASEESDIILNILIGTATNDLVSYSYMKSLAEKSGFRTDAIDMVIKNNLATMRFMLKSHDHDQAIKKIKSDYSKNIDDLSAADPDGKNLKSREKAISEMASRMKAENEKLRVALEPISEELQQSRKSISLYLEEALQTQDRPQ